MYNYYDRYLERWIISICNSNIKPIHVSICQAGIKYNRKRIQKALKILRNHDIKFTYTRIKFTNMGAARNESIKKLNNEWIMYLDVDDELLENGLKYLNKFTNSNYDVIVGGLLIKENKRKIKKFFGSKNYSKENLLAGKWLNSHSVFKRDLFKKIKYQNSEYCNNFFWAGIASINAKFIYIKYLCTIYNKHCDSHSETITKKKLNDWEKELNIYLKEIRKNVNKKGM